MGEYHFLRITICVANHCGLSIAKQLWFGLYGLESVDERKNKYCYGLFRKLKDRSTFRYRYHKKLETINSKKLLPSRYELFQIVTTFILVTFTWIFFRAENLTQAFLYIKSIFTHPNFFQIRSQLTYSSSIIPLLFYLTFLILIEWFNRDNEHVVADFLMKKKWYCTIILYV